MMLLDAHVHTNEYNPSLLGELERQCLKNNIKLLSVSMCIPSYLQTLELSKIYPFIIPSFGIHPWRADIYANNLSILDNYLIESAYIGEIGLDKKFIKYAAKFTDQQKVFEYIVSNKAVSDKFLNLHTSGAEIDVLNILERYNRNKFIVHWYDGDFETLDKYLSLGGYFTVGVEIMFSTHIQEIAKRVPLGRLLLETDNPSSYSWLQGCELPNGMPILLLDVINMICSIRNISEDDLLRHLYDNQKIVLML